MTPPYAKIVEKRDRSWSLRLLERLLTADIPDEERKTVAYTLTMLEDPRTAAPLFMVLADPTYSDDLRETASEILQSAGHDCSDETRERWWAHGDTILKRHALTTMGAFYSAIVESVASDPQHPLHRDAIDSLAFDFDLPHQQRLAVQALTHEDAEVRKTAADVLLWCEPIFAEDALLAATHDSIPAVVEAACHTLQYYPTQKVFRRMSELRTHEVESIRIEADKTYQDVSVNFLDALRLQNKRVRKHIRQWLAPIWDELAYTQKELKREKYPKSRHYEPKIKPTTTRHVLKLLTNPDTSPNDIFHLFVYSNWRSIPKEDRQLLTGLLLKHPDNMVRSRASEVFNQWGDQKNLIKLLDDEDFVTRKHAMYDLGKTSPIRSKIADIIWEYFQRERVNGTHGSETLKAYVTHAKPKQARPRLIELALDEEQPEGIRLSALWSLDTRKAALAVMPILEREPALTWALHIELLDKARDYKLKLSAPVLEHLREVDHLSIQLYIAPFL